MISLEKDIKDVVSFAFFESTVFRLNPVEKFSNKNPKMNEIIIKKNSHPSHEDFGKSKIQPNHREESKTE